MSAFLLTRKMLCILRSTLLRRRLSRLLVLPAALAPLRLRYVTPNPYLAKPDQRLIAVIALVGHHLLNPRTVRLHRLNLLMAAVPDDRFTYSCYGTATEFGASGSLAVRPPITISSPAA